MGQLIMGRFDDTVIRSEEDVHEWQWPAIEFLWNNPFSALFADLGLGKALMAGTILSRLATDLDNAPMLVIAPVRVAKQTWPDEIGEWAQLACLTYTILRAEDDHPEVKAVYDKHYRHAYQLSKKLGLRPQTCSKIAGRYARPFREQAKQALWERLTREPTNVHIINVEQVGRLARYWRKKWPYKTVIIDESSKFKNHSSDRFKDLNAVRPFMERLHLLTASPMPETHMDLFAQVYLLDRGQRLGRHITWFREEYFTHNPYTYEYKIKRGAAEKIADKIGDICYVMKAEDYLDREKPNFFKRMMDFDAKTRAAYDDFVDTFFLHLSDELRIEAVNAAALTNKLLQFTAGAVYDDERKVHAIHDEKLLDLEELRDELQGEPLMVAYWYKSSLDRLRKQFPKAVVMDKDGKAVRPWNQGKIDMLLIHPGSAGHGLNMQKGPGHDLVFFDLCWSRELYEQIIGRLDRQGQAKVVRVWHQMVRGTVDELVLGALHDKGAGQMAMLRFIKDVRARLEARRHSEEWRMAA
jgi:hypothetical protein